MGDATAVGRRGDQRHRRDAVTAHPDLGEAARTRSQIGAVGAWLLLAFGIAYLVLALVLLVAGQAPTGLRAYPVSALVIYALLIAAPPMLAGMTAVRGHRWGHILGVLVGLAYAFVSLRGASTGQSPPFLVSIALVQLTAAALLTWGLLGPATPRVAADRAGAGVDGRTTTPGRTLVRSFIAAGAIGIAMVAVEVAAPNGQGLGVFIALMAVLILVSFAVGLTATRGRELRAWLAAYGGLGIPASIAFVAITAIAYARCVPSDNPTIYGFCPGPDDAVRDGVGAVTAAVFWTAAGFLAGSGLAFVALLATRRPKQQKGEQP